jgi:uncharacterized protein
MSDTRSTQPGRHIHGVFAGQLVAEKRKLRELRESLDTVAAAQTLNPNGAADLPPPSGEIFSIPPDDASGARRIG